MKTMKVLARAKVNLLLRVLGKRTDGYHDLFTVFDRLSLADELELEPRPSGITLSCSRPDVPSGEKNLAWRAARAALDAAKSDRGVAIHLEKRVPAGAGLGGGSADAAAALVGTNDLLSLGLSEAMLLDLARKLGADVPFFVWGHLRDRERPGSGRTAIGRGVGEVLSPVSAPPLFYVLTNPGFEVSTAWVFQQWALTVPRGSVDRGFESIDGGKPKSFEDWLVVMGNDLEGITASRHREILDLKQALLGVGAVKAQMSGSGPTVFGVFASEGDARKAGAELEQRFGATKTLVIVATGQ